jgi:hypothetical protein
MMREAAGLFCASKAFLPTLSQVAGWQQVTKAKQALAGRSNLARGTDSRAFEERGFLLS